MDTRAAGPMMAPGLRETSTMITPTRRGRAGLCLATLVACCLAGPPNADAQDEVALRVQQFEPNADGLGYYTVESARATELGKVIFSLHANYATGVLATWNGDQLQTWAIRRQLGVDLQLGLGLKFVDVVVLLPFVPYQEGTGIAGTEFALHPFGDVAVRPKVTILHPDARPVGLAFAIPISFPTGKETAFAGEPGVTVTPTAIGEVRLGPLDVGINLGVRGRKPQTVQGLVVKSQLLYGFAARLRPFKGFGLQVELWGAGGSRNPAANPANWLAGFNIATQKGFVLRAGIGTGIGPGYGSPKVRAVFGIGAARPALVDRDRDAFGDKEDLCPGEKEDVDGFLDADGCPDVDNDGDTILDVDDACPDEPETVNDFEDEDGCPDELDPVAVASGEVPLLGDIGEPLPAEPPIEDLPLEDIPLDEVPLEEPPLEEPPLELPPAEEHATDKDGDGIADDEDPCPLYAEDLDGFEDGDGCPDEDDDGDGIADVDDACPREAEVYNMYEDDDGCPDEVSITLDELPATEPTGELVVEVDEEAGRLDVSENIYFDTAAATLRPESFPVLNKIATVLIVRDDIVGIEIQGHTDERGDAAVNRQLSKERADVVRQYLINLGVESGRLTTIGHGPDRPLDPGHDEAAWGRNRRVEFHIVE